MRTDLVRGFICLCSLVVLTACLPKERLNTRCEWIDPSTTFLDPSIDSDVRHLNLDANLAEDLGIRYGDTFRSTEGIIVGAQKRGECTRKLIGVIAARHRLSVERVEAARGKRNVWIDIALVYVPMAIMFCFVAYFMMVRIRRGLYDEPRWMLIVAVVIATPIVAGFGLMAGQQYEWLVEWARLRNAHLSYRAFRMPITQHALYAWIGAMILFVCVAALSDAPRGKRLSRSS